MDKITYYFFVFFQRKKENVGRGKVVQQNCECDCEVLIKEAVTFN